MVVPKRIQEPRRLSSRSMALAYGDHPASTAERDGVMSGILEADEAQQREIRKASRK